MSAPVKVLAGSLAASRVLFGAANLASPQTTRWSWIGRAANKPGTRVIIRSQGARDLGLGLGALRAIAAGDTREARHWLAASAIADGVDAVATVAQLGGLPKRRGRFAFGVAAASTVIAVAGAATLSGED